MKKIYNQGFVTLIFILAIALIATLILMIGQSRLFLALQRGQSFSDTLIAGYQAESEINDVLYRLITGRTGGLTFPYSKNLGENFKLEASSKTIDGSQTIDIISTRSFAVSQIQAQINSSSLTTYEQVEIAIMVDCSGSMDNGAGPGFSGSRMQAQSAAVINFLTAVNNLENKDNISVGLGAFSTNKNWVTTERGTRISPTNKVPIPEIIRTVQTRFGSDRRSSAACLSALGTFDNQDTNIGGGYTFMNDYFATRPSTVKKVQILITDGEPNSSNTYPKCSARDTNDNEEAGYQFLTCALTDTTKTWNGVQPGVRDPEILTYGVTVLNPASKRVNDIFRNTIGPDNYYTATFASRLSDITTDIFDKIVSGGFFITIKRVIPEAN